MFEVLEIFGFLHLGFIDILDILLVGILIFLGFHWIKGSAAMNFFIAVIMLFVLRVLAAALNMRMMSSLLKSIIDVGLLALIIIFQPEIRHFIIKLSNTYDINKRKTLFGRLFGVKEVKMDNEAVKETTEACRSMSEQKTGALIVIAHNTPLESVIETGDRIDANINRRLLMNLFFKNSPLHDGAVIICDDKIVAARCTLPITQRDDIPPSYGMRHKAAIGISEESDADVILVSEQTGHIVFVKEGNVTPINNINELKLLLSASLETDSEKPGGKNEKE